MEWYHLHPNPRSFLTAVVVCHPLTRIARPDHRRPPVGSIQGEATTEDPVLSGSCCKVRSYVQFGGEY